MVRKSLTLINLVWCVCAVTARPSHPSHATSEQKFIKYFNKNEEKIITRTGSEGSGDHEEYVNSYPSYEFSYKINDPYTHDIKGQQEKRHGDKVNGDYWLLEPDGRKRIVKYHANDKIGFKVLIDYLKKEGLPVSPIKEQKKAEEVEETPIVESEPEIEEPPAVESEPEIEATPAVKAEPEIEETPTVEEKKVEEVTKNNESQEKELIKESGEVKEEEKQKEEKEVEQKTRGKGKSFSAVHIKKIIRPRLLIRIINEDTVDNRKERPRELGAVKGRNNEVAHIRKDWSMKTEKPKETKKKNEKNNSDVKDEEVVNLPETTEGPKLVRLKNKGYEVEEKVIENDSEPNNAEQEIKQPVVANIIIEEKNVNTKNKVENDENDEEVYGYNTYIHHPHHKSEYLSYKKQTLKQKL